MKKFLLLDTKMDFIQHVIKDTEEIKTAIETATINIEKENGCFRENAN